MERILGGLGARKLVWVGGGWSFGVQSSCCIQRSLASRYRLASHIRRGPAVADLRPAPCPAGLGWMPGSAGVALLPGREAGTGWRAFDFGSEGEGWHAESMWAGRVGGDLWQGGRFRARPRVRGRAAVMPGAWVVCACALEAVRPGMLIVARNPKRNGSRACGRPGFILKGPALAGFSSKRYAKSRGQNRLPCGNLRNTRL